LIISDTCKNHPKRLDSDNTVNLSSLTVNLCIANSSLEHTDALALEVAAVIIGRMAFLVREGHFQFLTGVGTHWSE
jgi:hypothetical protein